MKWAVQLTSRINPGASYGGNRPARPDTVRGGGLPSAREGRPVRRGTTRLGGAGLLAPSNTPPPPEGEVDCPARHGSGSLARRGGGCLSARGGGVPDGARALVSDSAQFFRLCDRFMPREARNPVNRAEEPHGGHRRSGKTPSSTIRRVAKSKKLCRIGARPPREPAQRRAGGRRRTPPAESGPDPPPARPTPPAGPGPSPIRRRRTGRR